MNKKQGFAALPLIIIILAVLGLGGYFVYRQTQPSYKYQPTQNQLLPTTIPPSPAVTSAEVATQPVVANNALGGFERMGGCSEKECLFKSSEAVEGLGQIKGYYHPYEKEYDAIDAEEANMGNRPVTITCESLMVTGGSKPLIDNLIEWVKDGNTVNKLTSDNQLLLNISLTNVGPNLKTKISNSSLNNPVELSVIRVSPEGRDASPCESFVRILSINN